MSIDRSLKAASGLEGHRNVLTRAERIAKLAGLGKFDLTTDDPIGLPKVANRRLASSTKPKKAKATDAEAATEAPQTGEAADSAKTAAPASES